MTRAFIPKEMRAGETRVAATPDSTKRLIKLGLSVSVQTGAGLGSSYSDDEYKAAGATIIALAADGYAAADMTLRVNAPTPEEAHLLRDGSSLISFIWPVENIPLVELLAGKKCSVFAMDAIPRITRAQKDDALSSQTNLAGYKAVILAAAHLPKIFPMLSTAAGTARPSKVVILGAGVAGLQAIATAKRLGAVVEVSDVRPEVKEQCQSLGASYIEVPATENLSGAGGYAKEQSEDFKKKQAELRHKHLVAADVVITTALIPYRPAPKLVSAAVVEQMRPGSVIVDLAAERGGNCDLTRPGEIITAHGVTIIGTLNLPATLPVNASDFYARNVENVIDDMVVLTKKDESARDRLKAGDFPWNVKDEIVAGALIIDKGTIRHAPTLEKMGKGAK